MALTTGMSSLNNKTGVALGNRNDYCYLCASELVGKDEREYQKKFNALRGKHEGKPMMKIYRSGTETCICLEHIHKIAAENPLSTEE